MLLFSQLVRNTFPVSKRIPHSFFGKLICILYVLRLNMQQKILLGMWKMHMGTGMLRSPSRICVSGLNIILDHSKLQSSQFLSTFYESKYFYINTFKKSGGKKKEIYSSLVFSNNSNQQCFFGRSYKHICLLDTDRNSHTH